MHLLDYSDYSQQRQVFEFEACQQRSCVNIYINDDCFLEPIVETFMIVLDRATNLNGVLQPAIGHVEIMDFDDCKFDIYSFFALIHLLNSGHREIARH